MIQTLQMTALHVNSALTTAHRPKVEKHTKDTASAYRMSHWMPFSPSPPFLTTKPFAVRRSALDTRNSWLWHIHSDGLCVFFHRIARIVLSHNIYRRRFCVCVYPAGRRSSFFLLTIVNCSIAVQVQPSINFIWDKNRNKTKCCVMCDREIGVRGSLIFGQLINWLLAAEPPKVIGKRIGAYNNNIYYCFVTFAIEDQVKIVKITSRNQLIEFIEEKSKIEFSDVFVLFGGQFVNTFGRPSNVERCFLFAFACLWLVWLPNTNQNRTVSRATNTINLLGANGANGFLTKCYIEWENYVICDMKNCDSGDFLDFFAFRLHVWQVYYLLYVYIDITHNMYTI